MNKHVKKIDETLKELLVGILFYGIIVEILILVLGIEKFYLSLGLWIGIILGLASAIHMWWGLDRGVELGDGATKFLMSQNMIRYGVIVIAFGVLCLLDIGNPLAAFAGIMGLKAGAYLQPFTHKICTKYKRR